MIFRTNTKFIRNSIGTDISRNISSFYLKTIHFNIQPDLDSSIPQLVAVAQPFSLVETQPWAVGPDSLETVAWTKEVVAALSRTRSCYQTQSAFSTVPWRIGEVCLRVQSVWNKQPRCRFFERLKCQLEVSGRSMRRRGCRREPCQRLQGWVRRVGKGILNLKEA